MTIKDGKEETASPRKRGSDRAGKRHLKDILILTHIGHFSKPQIPASLRSD